MLIQQLLKRLFPGTSKDHAQNTVQSPSVAEPPAAQKPAPKLSSWETAQSALSDIRNGRLVIPDELTEIPARCFDGFIHGKDSHIERIVTVVVPGSVKQIGSRAFADCINLQSITFCEGVECIEQNVFTGCENLRKVCLPESIRSISGWTFYRSGLTEPVFSADGKTLIYYPQTWDRTEYSVPEGVEVIGDRAFIDAKQLTKVILPQSLKRICSRAFVDCGFTEITIPDGVVIESKVFFLFKHHVRIIRENDLDALEERMENCRVHGVPFLHRQRMKAPQEQYWKEESFLTLSQQCAAGSVEAMERMGDYFLTQAARHDDAPFYRCAANFWRVRAYLYGSASAKEYLLDWIQANPDARMTSPGIDEKLNGAAYGDLLNALGFMFFQEDREYQLSGVDQYGVVEVSSWESEDGPDEDGFGREEYYDWWYLNEYLTLPAGVGYIHSYSLLDKRNNSKRFLDLHDQVAAAGRKPSADAENV